MRLIIFVLLFFTYAMTCKSEHFRSCPDAYPWELYSYVEIICYPEVYILYCDSPNGMLCCDWFESYCECCPDEGFDLYEDSMANQLWDYACDEISEGNYSGSYTWNIYKEPEGITYYRSVEWECDSTTHKTTIDITVNQAE